MLTCIRVDVDVDSITVPLTPVRPSQSHMLSSKCAGNQTSLLYTNRHRLETAYLSTVANELNELLLFSVVSMFV